MTEIDTSTARADLYARWNENEAKNLRRYRADTPDMPELSEMHDETAATLRALAAERDALIAERAKLLAALKVCVMAHQTGIYDAACAAYEDAKVVLGMVPDPACDVAKEPSDDR
jgi:hypothetical protein